MNNTRDQGTIKKIPTHQVAVGMYIHDFDCSWIEIPFFRRSVMVTSDEMVEKIQKSGIREIYIDTARGGDVENAPTAAEVKAAIEEEILNISSDRNSDLGAAPLALEIQRASRVKEEAQKMVVSIMSDVKMGKQVEILAVENTVGNLVESVFRNPNALLCLSQLKRQDDYTFQHSVNVCILTIAFCKMMNFPFRSIREAATGALLHDIGKMKVPQEILQKSGKLSEDEFTIMKTHVLQGKNVIQNFSELATTAGSVILQHHERFDGAGYPLGLKGEEIDPIGHMTAIVDVYDAITSDRCYHQGIPPFEALRKIYEWSQYHFRRELVEHFIKCVGLYPIGSVIRMESGHIGVVVESSGQNILSPTVRLLFDGRRNTPIKPTKINVSNDSNKFGRIVGCESGPAWGINPLEHVGFC